MNSTYKKIDDILWKHYLLEVKDLEESVKRLNHSMVSPKSKEKIYNDLIIKLSEEVKNKIVMGGLS